MAGAGQYMPKAYPSIYINQLCYRLIPSHYPPIRLFEDLLDASELEAAYALESLTNDRLQDEVGNILMVPKEERMVGQGTSAIMAAFTHIGVPSRFTNGSFGVYYAGLDLDTAIAESKHSRARFMASTQQPPQTLTMRCYCCELDAELVDIRQHQAAHAPDSFAASQTLAQELRAQNEYGLLYQSVRYHSGQCVALFRPTALKPPAVQSAHFQFLWDGKEISSVLKVELYDTSE